MEVLDQPILNVDHSKVKYAGFWPRLGASLIDGVVVGGITLGLTYMNVISWKNPAVLIIISLLSLAYKPVLEHMYGATVGKMAVKLKVVNVHLEKASLEHILLRNIFNLGLGAVSLFFTIGTLNDSGFESVNGLMEYLEFLGASSGGQGVSRINGLLTIIDGIVLIADKNSRSLHDKIARTSVIRNI